MAVLRGLIRKYKYGLAIFLIICIVYSVTLNHLRQGMREQIETILQTDKDVIPYKGKLVKVIRDEDREASPQDKAEDAYNHTDTKCQVMLNIVTSFPVLVSNNSYVASRGYSHEDGSKRQARQIEFLDALNSNLHHPCVKRIHLLVESQEVKDYLIDQTLFPLLESEINSLTSFFVIPSKPTYKQLAQYASDNLIGQVVVFQNADIILGEGFNKLKLEYLKDRKNTYSLTRHGKKDGNSTGCILRNYCLTPYLGSHDTHIIYMHQPFSIDMEILNYPMNSWGAENVFMWATSSMGYNLRNPCTLLKVYHNHCSDVRSSQAQRVNGRHSKTKRPDTSLI